MSVTRASFEIDLENEDATTIFAQDLAIILKSGDCIALSGKLGAGKTTLARALIRAVASSSDDSLSDTGSSDLEVPSPTFTLVQEYDLRVPIGHFDLYRLLDASELDELGLQDILNHGAALIEWPERAEDQLPSNHITIRLEGSDQKRSVFVSAPDEFLTRWQRSHTIRTFLIDQGYENASRTYLLGDASTRAYERVRHQNFGDLILMNAPKQPDGPIIEDGKTYSELARLAEDIGPFIAIAKYLKELELTAPEIHAYSLEDGIALIEDLGQGKIIDEDNVPIAERYRFSMEILSNIHQQTSPKNLRVKPDINHTIPDYALDVMQRETQLLPHWYYPFKTGKVLSSEQLSAYDQAWKVVLETLVNAEKTLVLRDYHSPNIIWREQNQGLSKVGIIDFQDALIGPSAYDVASLAQDARVDISKELENELVEHYKSCRLMADSQFDGAAFDQAYTIMAAQRASKVLGIFVRLNKRDGKSAYLQHIPRIEGYIHRLIGNPALAPLKLWFKEVGLF